MAKNLLITVRVTPFEKKAIDRWVRGSRKTMSALFRERLLTAALAYDPRQTEFRIHGGSIE